MIVRILRRVGLVVGLVALMAAPRWAHAYTPESKEVKATVDRALAFLEKNPGGAVGEKALVALAFLKAGKEKHPAVGEALRNIAQANWQSTDNYSLGLSIILLGEITEGRDKAALEKLVQELISRQKPHGGWGYSGFGGPNMETGDISQTQYAALGLWTASQAGVEVPQPVVEKLCNYLIRVQDPAGSYGYQAKDPGNFQRIAQDGPTHSLTAGGLGAICVCADLLGISRTGGVAEEEETGLPEALKLVKERPKVEKGPIETSIDRDLLDRAIQDGSNWFVRNYSIINGTANVWNYYYLYGLERSETFREYYFYRKVSKEPRWYNDGVNLLRQKQGADGSWTGDHSAPVTTAFGVLFLQRSARRSLEKKHKDLGDGILTSGKGLPADLANASVKRGKVVDSPLAGEVDDLLAMLEDPENPELSRILEHDDELKLDSNLTKRTSQVAKLRSLVSAGNWEARMVAVRGLGKARDLDSVPVLLYALTDPDKRVVLEADTALRFISRKFQGVGLPSDLDPKADPKPIANARAAWRSWYLAIRPDAQLID